jgi:hypothetical protein
MPAYLARLIDNKEIVALVVAEDTYDLFWKLDECTDPYSCEVTELGSGSIFWEESGAQTLPLRDWDFDEDENEIEGETLDYTKSTISDYWRDAFYSDSAEWVSVENMIDEDGVCVYGELVARALV